MIFYINMLEQRPIITFGPPKTYGEALYRLGNYSGKDDEQLYRLGSLRRMLVYQHENLESASLNSRVLRLEEDDIAFMERWAFRRHPSLGFRKIAWNYRLSSDDRTSYFKVFHTGTERTLEIWWLRPGPTNPSDNLVCIKAYPGFEDALKNDWFVALLSRREYNLLVGEKVY